MAVRLLTLGRQGEAIPLLQTARQDPKLRTEATTQLGKAFLDAEFVDEAVDTFKALIEEYQLKGDDRSKQMYYWYARSLEAHKEIPASLKAYSQVAQWDFNYRDVQQRIKRLRSG
jgi:lipopolysaccharide biosynthesis regulator YciM